MREYILCMLFWVIFTVLLYLTGRAAAGKEKSESWAVTTGFLIYSVPVAAGGIVVQILNLKWIIFAGWMAAIWAALIGYILYRGKKNPGIYRFDLWKYIRENWVLYVILAAFTVMLFFYYRGFWLGNHLDDGYYVTKVASLPYTTTGYSTNFAVGVANAGFDSYIVNTWEIEASVYVKLLGVNPALYLRLFQSIFYYFLFLNVVKGFAENILQKLTVKVKASMIQLPLVITLVFGMYYIFLFSTNLLPLRDSFHFNTGMFLGGTMPKMLGIILLLFYFIDARKLSIQMVLGVAAVSLVMISKTSVVLPVIIVTAVSYLVTCYLINGKKKEKITALVILVLYCVAAFVLPGSANLQKVVYSEVLTDLHSPVLIISIVIFLCSFWLGERIINQINGIMILTAFFMLTPQINDIFETASIYGFVGGRAWTTWVYTLIILSSIYLCVMLAKLHVKETIIKAGYITLGIILLAGIPYGFDKTADTIIPGDDPCETNVKKCIQVFRQNKYFMPTSTIRLGEELEKLSKQSDEKLYTALPTWVLPDEAMHGLAVIIRTYAPDIVSVSATERYPVKADTPLASYDQSAYTAFASTPNDETAEAFQEQIQNTGINCVVVQNKDCATWLEEMGFQYDTLVEENSYYIWSK